MKILPALLSIVLFSISCVASAEDTADNAGAISGRISPENVSARIIAKTAGTEYKIKKNIKGEVTLTKGGDFSIKGLPAGKYDLLFLLQGDSKKKYFATRWSEVIVQPGKTTSGINYRLTPQGSKHLIDEVLVAFNKDTKVEEVKKTIRLADCVIKDTPLQLGETTIYTVDIPDNKSVDEMIKVFVKKRGVAYAEPNAIATIAAR